MGFLDSVKTAPSTVKKETDYVKGQKRKLLSTGIYDFFIKYAYGIKSKGGAAGVTVVLENSDGVTIKSTEYLSSGNAKGNKTYYEKDVKQKDGSIIKETYHLAGYHTLSALTGILLQKNIMECVNELRTIKLYSYDAKAEVNTEVEMLIELIGKPIKAAIVEQISDKKAQNKQTGEYEPTGKTYESNIIEKYIDPVSNKTFVEIRENLDAAFADQFLEKWKGQVSDISTVTKDMGNKGTPTITGKAAPKATLFS